ncbi:hypothetical protein C9374_003201 [Naegleria lovaniensis]|uniref:B box-type domain-containing protein n=1 Tax=Naegleria lovaniensis TaxID=51637 RepID=A0AA88KQ50_NAELO|nr:uncharacterized protein C9374_003201 [Naegleria lovaniensis]KAG2386052.1 hypothetical protein C9374_003201 [Naegleria lovaniensis]
MFLHCCLDCQEEEFESNATHLCQTCVRHLCEYHFKAHSRKYKNHQIILQSSLQQQQQSEPMCKLHNIPINCFCRSCETLICSVCGIDEHNGHNSFLISKIVEEEREIVKRQLAEFTKEREKWMKEICSIANEDLLKEWKLIENKQQELVRYVTCQIEMLRDLLLKRREELIQQIEKECKDGIQVIQSILNQESEFKELLNQFSNLSQMSGNILLEKKISVLKKTISNHENLVEQVNKTDIRSLKNIVIDLDKITLEQVKKNIQQLGEVKKEWTCGPSGWIFEYSGHEILDLYDLDDTWELYPITKGGTFNPRNFSFRVKIHDFVKEQNSWGLIIGIVNSKQTQNDWIGANGNGYGIVYLTGHISLNGKEKSFSKPLSSGDVVEVVYSYRSLCINVNRKGLQLAVDNIPDVDYRPAVSVSSQSVLLELL